LPSSSVVTKRPRDPRLNRRRRARHDRNVSFHLRKLLGCALQDSQEVWHRGAELYEAAPVSWKVVGLGDYATVPVVWTASGENKLRLVAGCWFHPSPKSNSSCLAAGCCEACGQPPTCGQGGGNAWRFPRLVHRGPRWRGQAGIGAADCPQIPGTLSAWCQAASADAGVDWPR